MNITVIGRGRVGGGSPTAGKGRGSPPPAWAANAVMRLDKVP